MLADPEPRGQHPPSLSIMRLRIGHYLRYTQCVRIIAGEFRGRRLLPPHGNLTRPITDRVKQSLFDILQPSIAEAEVFDLFAGTGSMGLECLSRGAKRATFFEADQSAVAFLKKNIAGLRVEGRSRVVARNLFAWFEKTFEAGAEKADLIFLDPPYAFLRERAEDLRSLAQKLAARLRPDGVVIFRHDALDRLELPPLIRADQRTYGAMTLEFLRVPGDAEPTADAAASSKGEEDVGSQPATPRSF